MRSFTTKMKTMGEKFAGIVTLFVLLCSCGNQETKRVEDYVDYKPAYTQMLDEYYAYLTDAPEDCYDDVKALTGVFEAKYEKSTTEALASVGYIIEDFSGSGIPELLIGSITKGEPTEIFAVYTFSKKEIDLSFEGWARNKYFWIGDNRFLNQGSEGAMSNLLKVSTFSKDEKLKCDDFYFTGTKEGSDTMFVFHNKSGIMDRPNSEEMTIYNLDFWKIDDKFVKEHIQLTPFSKYQPSRNVGSNVETQTPTAPILKVGFAATELTNYVDYDKFVASMSDSHQEVLFFVDKDIKDFKVLSLLLRDIDSEGKRQFDVTELYFQEKLTPKRPLVVVMTFFGTIPNNGVSYVDQNGVTRQFAVEMSGYDGSILLSEF